MVCFANDLKPLSLVAHQVKVHYALYDDGWSNAAREWYQCLSCSLDWRLEKIVGRQGWCVGCEYAADVHLACYGFLYH